MRARRLLPALLLVGATPAVLSAQNVAATPNFGELTLKESFLPDPQSVSVTSGDATVSRRSTRRNNSNKGG